MAEQNFTDQTIWTGDNLPILRGMNSESVDLIYLDPPFNSNANYAAPIGSEAAGAEFKDTWSLRDIDAEWIELIAGRYPRLYRVLLAAMTDSAKSYLAYMAVRLIEMRRILKPTGSIYLHCDPTMSHYLKLVMDAIFRTFERGGGEFRNEIVWCYTGPGNTKRWFPRKHDIVLFYAKSDKTPFYRDAVRIPYTRVTGTGHNSLSRGKRTDAEVKELEAKYALRGKVPEDHWTDIPGGGHIPKNERTGYPTQKPLALLRRIILASSKSDDMVLDPFCGCATTCIAAQSIGRQWVGIDISSKAVDLVKMRLRKELGMFAQPVHRTDIPQRTDLGILPPYQSHKQALYGQQSGNCAGCNTHFESRHLEVDHIIARSSGGTDHISNLQLLCGSCNRIKGNRGMEYLRVKLELTA